MNRREILWKIWLLAVACLCIPAQAAERPNVIVILADDLGYGDLSSYGSKFRTPNLDRMAAEGVQFTHFYTPMPFCAPTRAALLTGRYPFRSGMVFNPAPDAGIDEVGLPDEEITLGEAFKETGYATCAIGKWHLGHRPQFYPRRHGFDYYYGILYSNDMRPVRLLENEQVVEYPIVQATLTKRYTQKALDFIERNRNRSFFLYLPHAMPHKPLAASDEFYMTSPEGLYGDVIAELDWSVGQILAKLKELDLEKSTLVIFTSDNGPWFGGSTAGLRGMKGLTWDGGIRVPMIARWPGRIPTGVVCHEPAGIIDILPTVLRLAGINLPSNRVIDGKDIWPLMSTAGAKTPHDALFAMKGQNLAIVRSGQWKLHVLSPGERTERGENWVDPRGPDGVTILAPYEQARPSEYPGVTGGDGPGEMILFDLAADPAEQHDVAEKHPEVVKGLKAMFDELNGQVPKFKHPQSTPLQKPGPRPQPESVRTKPNIIFILADDLGYGVPGCYGQTKIATPHIDRLAVEGMRFTQHYAGSRVCAPSRSALMTGLHTGHTPIRANGGGDALRDEDLTVAELLKSAGYRTGLFGKWGLGTENTSGHPNRQGFEEFFGYLHQIHAHFYYPYFLWKNETKFFLPENEGKKRSRYSHDEIHAQALDFIRRSHQQPFFAYLAYTIPHVELVVPEDSIEPYRGKFSEKPLPDPRPAYIGADEPYATFAGMISRLDRHVGEVLALLKELGIDDNTIVFFTSDNGPQSGAWQRMSDFFDANGPLRGYKGDFYEGGIRVPLIVRWPRRIQPGTVTDHVSGFWDFLATAGDLAGAEPPASHDGISFLATLLGKGEQKKHEFLYWEYPQGDGVVQAARMGDWKAVQPVRGKPFELYNLRTDLGETRDVAAENPEVLKKIHTCLATAHTEARTFRPQEPRPTVDWYVR